MVRSNKEQTSTP